MIQFWETPDSGAIDQTGQRIEQRYTLSGTSDKFAALAHVAINTAPEISGIPRTNIRLRVFSGHDDLWDVTVEYAIGSTSSPGGPNPTQIGEERESFSTRGDRTRVTQALSHVADFPPSTEENPVRNHEGAINVTPDRIEGVEIDNAGFSFQIRKIIAADEMTQGYRQALFRASNRVNNTVWRGFQPGELRLVYVDASQRDTESWELVFQFQAIENIENATIGSISGIAKKGHEYLWAEFETVVGTVAGVKTTRQKLQAVHVERVYDEIDFQTLGLDA